MGGPGSGRRRKTAGERRVTGARARRPTPEGPPFAPGTKLAPPRRWPKRPGYERAEWGRIVPDLQRCGIAKAVHQGALEKICELYAASVVLYKKDYRGARMQAAAYREALRDFGLTPASAARVGFLGGAAGLGGDDPAAEFYPEAEFFPGPALA